MKIKVWRVEQAIWGADRPVTLYFRAKESMEEYYADHNYCTKLRPVMVDDSKFYPKEMLGPHFYDDEEDEEW